jgi:hypothetical protein
MNLTIAVVLTKLLLFTYPHPYPLLLLLNNYAIMAKCVNNDDWLVKFEDSYVELN